MPLIANGMRKPVYTCAEAYKMQEHGESRPCHKAQHHPYHQPPCFSACQLTGRDDHCQQLQPFATASANQVTRNNNKHASQVNQIAVRLTPKLYRLHDIARPQLRYGSSRLAVQFAAQHCLHLNMPEPIVWIHVQKSRYALL